MAERLLDYVVSEHYVKSGSESVSQAFLIALVILSANYPIRNNMQSGFYFSRFYDFLSSLFSCLSFLFLSHSKLLYFVIFFVC